MTYSASARTVSCAPRAAKNWNVPTRTWLAATRVSSAPGSGWSRHTTSPLRTAASARVVGMPSACIASPIRYSRSTGPTAALPSPPRENGVRPEPLRAMSRRRPCRSITSPRSTARPSPSCGAEPAELVSGVGLRDRRRARGHDVAGEHRGGERRIERGDVEAELRGERVVEAQELRRRHRRGRHRRVAARQLAGVGVVEAEQLGGGGAHRQRLRRARYGHAQTDDPTPHALLQAGHAITMPLRDRRPAVSALAGWRLLPRPPRSILRTPNSLRGGSLLSEQTVGYRARNPAAARGREGGPVPVGISHTSMMDRRTPRQFQRGARLDRAHRFTSSISGQSEGARWIERDTDWI